MSLIINGGYKKQELVDSLNGFLISDLNNNLQLFIKYMFPNIKDDDVIFCNKSNYRRINMVVSVGGVEKNVSIKTGSSSVVYKDYLFSFITHLAILDTSAVALKAIMSYHFADGTIDGSGDVFSFGELLKEDFKNEIEIIRKEFENKELLSNVIDYVLLEEKNGKTVDFFYYGNVKCGFYISADEFKDKLLNKKDNYPHRFMMIGPFNFVPLARNIKYTDKIDVDKLVCKLKINNILKYIKK